MTFINQVKNKVKQFSDFELAKDSPYLILMDKLMDMQSVYFIFMKYQEFTLYMGAH